MTLSVAFCSFFAVSLFAFVLLHHRSALCQFKIAQCGKFLHHKSKKRPKSSTSQYWCAPPLRNMAYRRPLIIIPVNPMHGASNSISVHSSNMSDRISHASIMGHNLVIVKLLESPQFLPGQAAKILHGYPNFAFWPHGQTTPQAATW